MSTTSLCESCGSQSATSDYCDMCGAAIGAAGPGAASAASPGSTAAPADPSGIVPAGAGGAAAPDSTCSFCGAPRAADDVSCEVCGLDFVSGQMPWKPDQTPVPPSGSSAGAGAPAGGTSVMPTSTASGAASRWSAVVGADRAFFDGNVTAGVVAFPDAISPRDVPLAGDEVSIGRRSESKGYFPDIDLSSPVDDPAVSRRHAALQRQADGSYAVVDVGSTNGTWVNDDDDPIAAGVVRALHHGDRILLGAFTAITIRDNAPSAAPPVTPPPAPAPPPAP